MAQQQYTSAQTSRSQVPALHRALLKAGVWASGTVNVDIGGGRFDKASQELSKSFVTNLVYDPYNRSQEHNDTVLLKLQERGADTATVANVLCVIAEDHLRAGVVALASKLAPIAFFSIYEGNRSGIGGPTRDGWQENRALVTYVKEIAPFFDKTELQRIGGVQMIVAQRG